MEQATFGQRTFRVERIERAHAGQGPVFLHGARGAVYGTLRFFANIRQPYEAGEPLFLVNGKTGAVDPLGSSVMVIETADGGIEFVS